MKDLPKNKVALRKAIKNLQKKKKKLFKTISKNLRASQLPGWHHWTLEYKEYELLRKIYVLVKLKEKYVKWHKKRLTTKKKTALNVVPL